MAAVDMTVREITRLVGVLDVGADGYVKDGNDGSPYLFPNDGQTFLALESGTGCTLTFLEKADEMGRLTSDKTFVLGATKFALVGPFSPHLWNNTDGEVSFTISAPNADDYFLAVRLTNSERNGV